MNHTSHRSDFWLSLHLVEGEDMEQLCDIFFSTVLWALRIQALVFLQSAEVAASTGDQKTHSSGPGPKAAWESSADVGGDRVMFQGLLLTCLGQIE